MAHCLRLLIISLGWKCLSAPSATDMAPVHRGPVENATAPGMHVAQGHPTRPVVCWVSGCPVSPTYLCFNCYRPTCDGHVVLKGCTKTIVGSTPHLCKDRWHCVPTTGKGPDMGEILGFICLERPVERASYEVPQMRMGMNQAQSSQPPAAGEEK